MPSDRSEFVRSALGSDPDWLRELDALREVYRTRLIDQLGELESILERSLSSEGNARDAADAQRLAHRLMGTAGTYGFVKASEMLHEIGERLAPAPEPRSRGREARQTDLIALVRGIRGEL